jgi:CRP/FNR family transcriptional regulator, cyclic AMP receptor protein
LDATLRRAAILQGTDRGAARALARRLTRTDFPSGHTIFAEGQPGDRLYIVVSGKVKITCRAGTGREAVLAVMGPSDMFGELSVFDPGPRTSSAVTLTKVRTMTMDRATFRWWIAEAPQVRERLLAVLSRRLRRTNDDLCALVFTDVSGRVARQLLDLGARFGVPDPHGLRVNHDLTQENFAALVGSTRPSVNRALTDFAHRGWIEIGDRSVIIVDAEQLARRAQ